MLELVNLSNVSYEMELLLPQPDSLMKLLAKHSLAGIELMIYEPWNEQQYPKEKIKGVHLKFWPSWLDFWLGDRAALTKEFGSQDKVTACFGGAVSEQWLEVYRRNILDAAATGAEYVVFHVAQARSYEMSSRQYFYDDSAVIEAVIAVVNKISAAMPEDMLLLFENLWWPGMTLLDRRLVEKLFAGISHKKAGIMLDTGHLMNTAFNLRSESDAVKYVINTVNALGDAKKMIRGMHLHKSLSGEFVAANLHNKKWCTSPQMMMQYVLNVDQHLPFETTAVRELTAAIAPDYLVHEFIQESYQDWSDKLTIQRRALGWE